MTRWSPDTVRENPDRLRNLRVLDEELTLLLRELGEMDLEDREAAVEHHRQIVRLLDRMRDEAGEPGPPPHVREERLNRAVRTALTRE